MNQYIITEEQMKGVHDYLAEENNDELRFAAYDILDDVHSSPYDPQAESEKVYRQLMAASINNENPGWVQIAEIGKILNPFNRVIPDIENLQEFPFRSYPKKETCDDWKCSPDCDLFGECNSKDKRSCRKDTKNQNAYGREK